VVVDVDIVVDVTDEHEKLTCPGSQHSHLVQKSFHPETKRLQQSPLSKKQYGLLLTSSQILSPNQFGRQSGRVVVVVAFVVVVVVVVVDVDVDVGVGVVEEVVVEVIVVVIVVFVVVVVAVVVVIAGVVVSLHV